MKALAFAITAAAAAGGFSAPAAAAVQDQGDVQAQRIIGGVIDTLIGNRYNVNDRQAIRRCGVAAVRRAEDRYRGDFHSLPVAYPGYRGHVRVSDITDVQRRLRVVRVKGLLTTARYGYGRGQRHADLSFRCDVDYRGNIADLRVERNPYWRR